MKKILLIGFLLLAVVLAGCAQVQTNEEKHMDAIDDHMEETEEHMEVVTGSVKEIDVIARNWEFVPSTIEVNLGDRVQLHVKSVDVPHGFRLPDFGINEQLEPQKDVHIEFTADKKGVFPFSCSVPCGKGHRGMSGQLVVN